MYSLFPPHIIIFSNILTPNSQEYSSNKPLQTPRGEKSVRKLIRPAIRELARRPPQHPLIRIRIEPTTRHEPVDELPPDASRARAPLPAAPLAPSRRPAAARLASPFAFAALSGLAPAPGRGFDEQRPDRVGRVVELVSAALGSGRLPSGATSVLLMRAGISHVLSCG